MKTTIGAVLPYLILSVNHLESLAWKSPTKLRPIFSTLKASSSLVRSISSDVKYDKVLYFRGGSEEEDSDNDSSEFDEDEDEEYNSSSLNKEEDEENMNATNDDTGEEIKSSLSSSAPIKVTLKTAVVNNPLIDISIEITASPKRTVQSLKQSVSRQFKARPPMDSIQLRLDGKFLDDDTLLEDLIVDDEEEDDHGDEEDDDGVHKLTILVDMIPPVDPKFGTEIKARLDDTTNEQLLEAYVVNLAAMHQNSMEVMAQQMKDEIVNELLQEENDETDLLLQEVEENSSDIKTAPINLTLQKYANNIKSQVISFLSEDQKKLLEKKDTPSSPDKLDPGSYSTGDVLLKESIKRKRRGGARMNMKRVIQKNLNIVSGSLILISHLKYFIHSSSHSCPYSYRIGLIRFEIFSYFCSSDTLGGAMPCLEL